MGGISIVYPPLTKVFWRKTVTTTPQLKRRCQFKTFYLTKTSDPSFWIRFVVFLYAREY